MLPEIIVCAFLSPITPGQISDYRTCKDNYEKIEYVQEYIPLVQENFEQKDWQTALLVIFCESRGKPNAKNVNTKGEGIYKNSVDQGIWQWNSVTYTWLKEKLKITSSPYDIEVSTKATAWTVKHVGWEWWNSSKHCWGNT